MTIKLHRQSLCTTCVQMWTSYVTSFVHAYEPQWHTLPESSNQDLWPESDLWSEWIYSARSL